MDELAKATDLRCHPITGSSDILIRFKTATGQIAVAAPPKIVGELLATLLHAVAHSNDPELKGWLQALALRDFEPGLTDGIPTLTYEVEAGYRMTTTIPADSAARAVEVWGKLDPLVANLPAHRH